MKIWTNEASEAGKDRYKENNEDAYGNPGSGFFATKYGILRIAMRIIFSFKDAANIWVIFNQYSINSPVGGAGIERLESKECRSWNAGYEPPIFFIITSFTFHYRSQTCRSFSKLDSFLWIFLVPPFLFSFSKHFKLINESQIPDLMDRDGSVTS